MTDNGVAALAKRLDAADDLPWIADSDLDPHYHEPTNADKAAAILADGSRFLSREAVERQEAIEEAARAVLARGDRAVRTPTWTPADRRRYEAEFAALRLALGEHREPS